MSHRDPAHSLTACRAVVAAYRSMLPVLEEVRRDSNGVEEMLAVASVTYQINDAIVRYSTRVRKLEASIHAKARHAAKCQRGA